MPGIYDCPSSLMASLIVCLDECVACYDLFYELINEAKIQ